MSSPCLLTTLAARQDKLVCLAELVTCKCPNDQYKGLLWQANLLPRVKVFLSGGWRKFSCRCWPDQSELRAAAGFVSRQPWRACWEQRRAVEYFPPEYYNVSNIREILKILQKYYKSYIVSCVDWRPALQEKIYGWDWREVTDGISPNRWGVSTAGQVEGAGASSSLGSHLHELVNSLLHVVNLR